MDRTDGPWREYSLLDKRTADQFKKYQCSVSHFCVLVEIAAIILKQHGFVEKRSNDLVEKLGISTTVRHPRENPWSSYGRFTWPKQQSRCSRAPRRCWRKKAFKPSQFHPRIIFMSMNNDILWWANQNNKAYVVALHCVSLSPLKASNQDDGHF